LDIAYWCWVVTLSFSADTVGAECVFNAFTAGQQMTDLGIRKETEPGAVGILLADVEALELIFGSNYVNILTVGAFSRNKTLEVTAVSWIWKLSEKK
jgi:hypothetical protein